MKRYFGLVALAVVVSLGSGCASLAPQDKTVQAMTWKSVEEAVDNYRLVTVGETTVNELINVRGFNPDKVSMSLREENPTKIRNEIMGVNPNVRHEDLTKNERACLDAKEHARSLVFPIRVTIERSEGNFFLEKLKIKKERREVGKTFNAWFCYNADSGVVLYKTMSYGYINQLRVEHDPISDSLLLLLMGIL
ncbi:MAG: hypothetical protein Q7S52_03300 [bacterium]|nr:hypothetical protein [bacterium]